MENQNKSIINHVSFKPILFRIKQACAGIVFLGVLTAHSGLAAGESEFVDSVVVIATALKIDTPAQETPKSVSFVTQEDLVKRAPQKLDESLRYTSGVTAQPYGADNDTDWFRIRGFDAATYLDGNRLFRDGYYTWLIEPYGVEQIEVIKGPSSILYGEAPPGGLVNIVQKKPGDTPSGEIRLQGGNKNFKAAAVDITDKANEKGSVRYRIVATAKENDGELDGTENTRYYLAPSVAFDFSQKTHLTVSATVLKDDGIPTNPFFPAAGTLIGTPLGRIDPSTNLGEPGYDNYERTQISLGYLLEHELNDTWTLSQNFNYGYNELYLRSSYAFPNNNPTATTLFRGIVFRDGHNDSYTIDNKAVAQWRSPALAHTVLMGADLQYHETQGQEQDSFAFGTINPYAPEYGNFSPLNPENNIDRDISKFQFGVYAQYQLEILSKWIGVFGGRYDSVETENQSEKNNQDESRSDNELSVNTGLMYLAGNGLSPYINYSRSFDILSTIDPATGKLYNPLEGEQIEAGIKYTPEWFDGYVNLAFFDITQKNALVANPNTFVSTQTGEVTSQGVELEGVVQITDALKLSANYTYTKAETDDTGGQGTRQAALIPEHMASAWIDFDAAGAGIPGLTIGTGVRYVGESKDNPKSSDLTVPSVTLWDASVSYHIDENWTLQLNLNNILDKTFVSGCDYYCYYGESRSIALALTYGW